MLKQAMSGDLDADATDTEFIHEMLDLCAGCKGCARDCPSEVDMAKLKAEVEHAHHQREGASLRDYLLTEVDRLSELGSRLAPLSNWVVRVPGTRTAMEKTADIARERSLPTFHRKSLEDWLEARGGARVPGTEATDKVFLFPDGYTNYNHPGTGKATVRVLETAGVHVSIPDNVTAAGYPAHSKGFLDRSWARAEADVDALAPRVEADWSVVLVESSDAIMFQSDYLDLLLSKDVERVVAETYDIIEYLDAKRLAEDLDRDVLAGADDETLTYHGHCHQKVTRKDHHAVGVLRRTGYDVDPLDSGCCGMARSFGYEAEYRSLSTAIGGILADQISGDRGDTVVIPSASCRTQLEDVDSAAGDPPHPIEKASEVVAD